MVFLSICTWYFIKNPIKLTKVLILWFCRVVFAQSCRKMLTCWKNTIFWEKIIPGRQDTLDLSKLYTNLPLDMPEGCIYFWDVSFSPFRRNNFFSRNIFLKSIKFRPFWTIFLYYKVLVKTQKHHSAPKFVWFVTFITCLGV